MTASTLGTSKRIVEMCHDCAGTIYGSNPPSERYRNHVASLLAGTAATESHMKYRRQLGFSWESDSGAWGLWQTERAAVGDSMAYLVRRPDVATRAMQWLFQDDDADLAALLSISESTLLRLIAGWDRLACLFARIHYMRFPEPIPSTDEWRAEYWKAYYNTHLGAGTVEKYMEDYNRLVKPVL